MWSAIISLITFTCILFGSAFAAPTKKQTRNVTSISPLTNEKETSIFIKNRIDEISNAAQFKSKVEKLKELYRSAQKQADAYTEDLIQLFLEQDKLESQLNNATSDTLVQAYTKLKKNIDQKQKILERWNDIVVGFKPLYDLFVRQQTSEDLNCDVISHKIYLSYNGNLPDGEKLPPLAELAQKMALDFCRTQDVSRKSQKN